MDNFLCDELLQEIFRKLPPSSSFSISLVSKRWLQIYRTSVTSLSLRLSFHNSSLLSFSSLLSHYPFLLSLSLSSDPTTNFSDHLFFLVCTFCSKLQTLRCLTGPVSLSSLLSLSKTCVNLTSLCINHSRPLIFNWVVSFPCLRELSVFIDGFEQEVNYGFRENEEFEEADLGLEILCLSGIKADDFGVGWLWRSCKKLKKLKLKSCEGIGDGGSFSSFIKCLNNLKEIEIRTCRSIIDGVLLKLAENCDYLSSLLVYDGGSSEGLLRFIVECRSNLQKLDFRLPLDLVNDHLFAISTNSSFISTLRLQSCCLLTGEGLKSISIALSDRIEELALINCDVLQRETGLLSTLGQNLKKLRKLDLSYNEMLADKELVSMVVSCNSLVDFKLRGCERLTSVSTIAIVKRCKMLEDIDLMYCSGIPVDGIEFFLVNSPTLLRRIEVEGSKISDVARTWANKKFIELVV